MADGITMTGSYRAMIPAEEAAARLGVRLPTLYAYVSRGMIRNSTAPGQPRARLYALEDIERLVWRKTQARKPSGAAASALSWGLPVLETEVSAIEDGRLSYHGQDVSALAERASLEEIAAMLWHLPPQIRLAPLSMAETLPGWHNLAQQFAGLTGIDRALVLMARLRVQPNIFASAGHWPLVQALACAFAGLDQLPAEPLHLALSAAWQRPAAEVIRRILVASADHELNSSTFTVRVAASTGVDAATCLVTGLTAMTGMEHVGQIARTRMMLAEALSAPDLQIVLNRWARPHNPLPGFYHRLYPEGDPRAAAILAGVDLPKDLTRLVGDIHQRTGLLPNVEFALIAAERTADLPLGAAEALFIIGRSVGWIAHAEEQRRSGIWIRPRAQKQAQP